MKDLPLENKVLKFGTTSINSLALKGMTKEEFTKAYKGNLHTDINQIWKEVKKYTKK